MSELLPTRLTRSIQDGLLDYLTTTFALADDDARLARFWSSWVSAKRAYSRDHSCDCGCRFVLLKSALRAG